MKPDSQKTSFLCVSFPASSLINVMTLAASVVGRQAAAAFPGKSQHMQGLVRGYARADGSAPMANNV